MISKQVLIWAAEDCVYEIVSNAETRDKLKEIIDRPTLLPRSSLKELVLLCADEYDMFTEVNTRLGNNVSEHESETLLEMIVDNLSAWRSIDDSVAAYERAMEIL